MTYHNRDKHVETANELDKVSDSYCVAKWKQVTLHLQNGHTHSCHHPRTHKIPVSEIQRNPSALHNTSIKKEQRRMMLDGVRPPECSYCWRVEDSEVDHFSDRITKSAEPWARPFLQDCANKPFDYDVDPSYVEVSFGSTCNFKCSYCAPHISSKWMEEIQQYGPYDTKFKFNNLEWTAMNDMMPIPNREYNPYVDAFWDWWPRLYNELQHFRITGGEPLLVKDTFKVLEYIIANPNPNLEVSVNTNLCVPDELLDKFLLLAKQIVDNKCLKLFRIYTSCEAYSKQADYIRHGMDYEQWINNLHKVYKLDSVPVTIMSTYNLMSVFSYRKFLEDMLIFKKTYISMWHKHKSLPLYLDIPFLNNPQHQTAFLLPKSELYRLLECIDFMKENRPYFVDTEIEKILRIYDMLLAHDESVETENRRDFIAFVNEHDKRRNTDFLETFPEMEEIYEQWSTYLTVPREELQQINTDNT